MTEEEIEKLVTQLEGYDHHCGCYSEPGHTYTCDHCQTIAAIRQLLNERKWHPIETAPTDGQSIIVGICEEAPFDVYWEARGEITVTGKPGWCDGSENKFDKLYCFEPKVWFPLLT
jgi:hypothetical protein